MKIIDQTPFFNEKGEIGLIDRGKAMLQYGSTWLAEIEAQKAVMPVLGGILDRNYTLLRNVTPPGLDTSIPFILIGPTGVLVIYVTPLAGMFRAKGDQWGTVVGNTYRIEKPNLLTRTERMARAVQVYLQRQGFSEMLIVEAVLLCSNPAIHVDSLRPIVRVVMRDALERFAASIAQARVMMSADAVQEAVERILSGPRPQPPPEPEPAAPQAATPAFQQEADLPAFLGELADGPAAGAPVEAFSPWGLPEAEPSLAEVELESAGTQPSAAASREAPSAPPPAGKARPARRFNRRQWLLLIVIFLFWVCALAVFAFLVVRDLSL